MKVSELIAELQQLDQNLEVYCMTQENNLMASGDNNVRTFAVDSAYSLSARQFYDSTFELVAEILDSSDKRKIAVIEFSMVIK